MITVKFWLITLFYVCLAIVVAVGLDLLVRRVPDISQPVVEKELWIYKDHPVTQTVTPKHNGFNVVVLYLRNVILRNQGPFTFTLTDKNGTEVSRIDLNGYNITDGGSVRMQFPPIPDSKDQTYTITLSAPTPDITTAIGVGYNSDSNSYPAGLATAENITGGDMTFHLYYSPQKRSELLLSTFNHILKSLFSFKLVALFVASFATVFGFTWHFYKRVN